MNEKYLVIVESPTKEKTIGKILGKEYAVKSSYGHVRDLPAKELGVDENSNFKPTYVIIARAKKNIAALKASAKNADIIYLATDHDREGESIAWHLAEVIKPSKEKIKRITFHEITADAILNSIKNARAIDFNLVAAQQARRVLDRLVGYKLSPLLWKKIAKGLSAGRVQSVAVRLLVERAKEIKLFKSKDYWSIKAKFAKLKNGIPFEAKLVKWQGSSVEKTLRHKLFAEDYTVKSTIFDSKESIGPIADCLKKNPITVINVERKETRQKPKPPFITSSLQQEAYTKLGFSASRTMQVAQSLYEGVSLDKGEVSGLITYMRTDSFNVSNEIKAQSRKFIKENFGENFAPQSPPSYVKKVKGAQEAHEAIHPTNVYKTPEKIKSFLTKDQFRLYEIIWLKFIASQMSDAVFNAVTADISAGDKALFRAGGRTVKFEGYLKVYKRDTDLEKEGISILPPLEKGDELKLEDIITAQHQTQPPPIYNEASLIKTLERHGIGRPSTYAPIIKTIVERKYVLRQKGGKLSSSLLGTTVTEKLKDFFPDIMELSYTAGIEEKLDEIAEGNIDWVNVIKDFYIPFTDFLKHAYDKMETPKVEMTSEKCPLCQSNMVLRQSRFGKYLSCSKFPKCKGKIPLDKDGKKIIPEKTDKTCPSCGKQMVIKVGRRGKFLACSDYPSCKTTCSIDTKDPKADCFAPIKTDRMCDKCNSPLILRKSARGYFLGCSKFPKCRNIVTVTDEELQKLKPQTK